MPITGSVPSIAGGVGAGVRADWHIEWEGDEAIIALLRQMPAYLEQDLGMSISKVAEIVMQRSAPLVPIGIGAHAGTLRDSGVIEPPSFGNNQVSIEFGYGIVSKNAGSWRRKQRQEAANYAWVQHEAMHYRHPRGGQAKYLEQPLMATAPEALQIMALFLKKRLANRSAKAAAAGKSLKAAIE